MYSVHYIFAYLDIQDKLLLSVDKPLGIHRLDISLR